MSLNASVRSADIAILSVSTAVPPLKLTQRESLDYILSHYPLKDGTRALYKRVFRNESIQTRHFALKTPDEILDTDLDRINQRFQKAATALATEALLKALSTAGIEPAAVDFLVVTTCTGYLCPGLSAYMAEGAGLRKNIQRADLVGMGCGAALPALEQACNYLRANPRGTAAVVSAEISTAAMISDDAADLVISNALFGDGAAAAVLSGRAGPSPARLAGFADQLYPAWRDSLRFKTQGGRLRNTLTKEVPAYAAQALRELLPALLNGRNLAPGDITHWLLHAGGDKILDAARQALNLPEEKLIHSRRVLRDFGNMSSPTVLFVLQDCLASTPRKGFGVMASFGAGFSAHGALLEF